MAESNEVMNDDGILNSKKKKKRREVAGSNVKE